MRSAFSFILRSVCVVTGLGSSAMGHRQRLELGDLPEPEVAMRQLGVRDGELGRAHGAVAEPHDVEVQRAGPPPPTPLPPPPGPDGPALPRNPAGGRPGSQGTHLVSAGAVWNPAAGAGP